MYLETADIETASEGYAARFRGPAGEYFLARQADITLKLLGDMPGARVLEVGGGHAQLAEPLLKNGYNVTITGSDDSCRRRLDQRLATGSFTYLTCDSLSLPFDDRSFDVVMAFRLLPHVDRWQQLLAELCRVADKCLIVDYPDRRSTNILYSQLFAMKKKMEGNTRTFTLFTRRQMANEVTGHGFNRPRFTPEFLLPMVVHRKLDNKALSNLIESSFRLTGLTKFFGSPIIFRSDRRGS